MAKETFTDEQRQDYVDAGGLYCPDPKCQSDDLRHSTTEHNKGIMTLFVTCNGCGKQWNEVYRLVDMNTK